MNSSNSKALAYTSLFGLLLSTACLGQEPQFVGARVAASSVVAFQNVTVIPMTGQADRLEHQIVIIQDGRISEIGPTEAIEVPSDAFVIDGSGRYLLPGLIDLHIHLRARSELLSYLRYGVTTAVQMGGASGAVSNILCYKQLLQNQKLIGPLLYSTGPILDGATPTFPGVSTSVLTPHDARDEVLSQFNQGYDFIKIYNGLTPSVSVAVNHSADDLKMAVVGHIPRQPSRQEALQFALHAGQDMIAHVEEYFFTFFYEGIEEQLDAGKVPNIDESNIGLAVQMTKDANAYVTPSLSFVSMTRRQLDDLDSIFSDPEIAYLDPEVKAMWRRSNFTNRPQLDRFRRRELAKYPFLQKLTNALSHGGVPLLLGTDSSAPGMFPGRSAHLELEELVKAGLSPYNALEAGTANAGEFIGRFVASADSFGKITTGGLANLMLLESDPTTNISHSDTILGVMVRGNWYGRSYLDALRNLHLPQHAKEQEL